jgi:hypothetical protein
MSLLQVPLVVARLAGLVAVPLVLIAAGPATAQAPALAPGTITTVAGGIGGPGPGLSVGVSPCAVTYAGGSLYATDLITSSVLQDASVIRKVSVASGALTTVAGNGTDPWAANDEDSQPSPPDGSLATAAEINASCGVAVDGHGNLLLSDSTDYVDGDTAEIGAGIRVVAGSTGRFYGRAMLKGHIYTIVSVENPLLNGSQTGAIAVDPAGNVLFTTDENVVYALAEASGAFYGQFMRKGGLYPVAGGAAYRLASGIKATSASLDFVDDHYYGQLDAGIRIDHHGNLVIADDGDCLVRVVPTRSGRYYGQAMLAGRIYTIAGDDECGGRALPAGGAVATKFPLPALGIAIDHAGNIVATAGRWVVVIAASTGRFYGQPMHQGRVYRIAGRDTRVLGNGGPALNAEVAGQGVSVDGAGNVVIADRSGLRFIPEHSGPYYGRHGLRIGDIYPISAPGFDGYGGPGSGDGGPAIKAAYGIGGPADDVDAPLATDQAGDLFVVNGSDIRMIPAASRTVFGRAVTSGYSYRIGGVFDTSPGQPPGTGPATSVAIAAGGIAADAHGNLLIAETGQGLVRVVAATSGTYYGQQLTAGDIYTVAGGGTGPADGGPALGADLSDPVAVTTDANGVLLISASCQVLAVPPTSGTYYGQPMTAGDLYPIAGTGSCQSSGLGGPALAAGLPYPRQLAVDPAGNVLIDTTGGVLVIAAGDGRFYGQQLTAGDIYLVAPAQGHFVPFSFTLDRWGNIVQADYASEAVDVLAESDGTYYGQPMTAGDTYQIAGNGLDGHAGTGGLATSASLLDVGGVAGLPDGDLILTEDHWISRITG